MLDIEYDIAFLKDLHFSQRNTTEENILKDAKQSGKQKLFYGTADSNFNFEVENRKLEFDKDECGQLQEVIKQKTEELNTAEKLLEELQNKKETLKRDMNSISDKVSVQNMDLISLKRKQRAGSGDRRLIKLQSLLLSFHETLFKMKLHDSSMTEDKLKNFVHGFIYNKQISYVHYFTLPLVRGIAWDLLPPAAQLSWSIDDDEDITISRSS